MGKIPIYFFVALIFLGLTKLLQVTIFDSEQYEKVKKMSLSSIEKKALKTGEKKQRKENKNDTLSTTPMREKEIQKDTSEIEDSFDSGFENDFTSDIHKNEIPKSEKESIEYDGLSDLKNSYLAPILANLPTGQLREDIVIRYYKHQKDGDKVYVLHNLGYYIHEKKATETAGLGSNTVYYGEDVSIEDIKIVAYSLLEQGLPLKAISPTQFDWKSTSLEIGTDPLLTGKDILTDQEIKNFKK